jgi:PAS domain S-box-containing protein
MAIEGQQLKIILESIGDAVISTDSEGRITFVNRVALSLLRAREDEVVGRPFDEAFPLENDITGERVESPVARVLREDIVVGLANNTILIARDGTRVPIDDNAAPVHDETGNLKGTVLVFRDVSERQRFEQTSRVLASIVESSDDAIVGKTLDGVVISWNKGAEKLFGYSASEIIGKPISTIAPPDRMDEMRHILETIRNGERIDHYETIRCRKDGRLLDISLTVSPIKDAEGRIIGASKIARDITARKRADEATARLAAIVSSSDDAVISKDLHGIIMTWNAGAERMFGYTAEEVIGRPVTILMPPERVDEEPGILARIRNGEKIDHYETIRRRKDGTLLDISLTISPIKDAEGRIIGASKIARDITARKRAEEATARLAAIVSSSDDAVISKDLNGIIKTWNAGAERMFGYTAEEVIGKPVTILMPPERVDEEPGILARIRNGEKVDHYETIRRRKDGALLDISLTVSPIKDPEGRIIGASKIARDITEQHRARTVIAEQRERFRVTLGSIGDSVIATDAEGIITLLNPAAEELTGWLNQEAVGKPIEQVFRIINEETRRTVENPTTKVLREGVVVGLANHTLLIARDGQERSIDDSAAPIRNHQGQTQGVVLIFRDVTDKRTSEKQLQVQAAELRKTNQELRTVNQQLSEQRRDLITKDRALAAEKTLRETEAELARVLRALSIEELATSIAHEINQPLAGVVTNAEAALRWLNSRPPNILEAKESLTLIARDGNRASTVIRRIREFLKKETQEIGFLDVNEIVQEAVDLTKAELVRSKINLRFEPFKDLPRVRAYRIPLQQVMVNLILNGVEAMVTTEGRDLLIQTENLRDGKVRVSVRDSGLGCSAETLPKIFNPFFTTKPTGLGMGLAISRTIVEASGGTIWAELNNGPGITVRFELPTETDQTCAE